MKTIDRLVLKSYAGPMVLAFLIVIFILLMQSMWLRMEQLVGKGLEITIIFEFIYWVTLASIPMALPLSTLFASLMTMGNMGESNELLALKAAGISLRRILTSLVVLILITSAFAFYASNNLLPLANLKMKALLTDIKRKRPDVAIETGVFYNGIANYTLKILDKEPKTNLLKGVMIYDHTKGQGNVSVTIADSGYIKSTPDGRNLLVTLFNGNTYEDELEQGPRYVQDAKHTFTHREFKEQDFIVKLEGYDLERSDEEAYKGNAMMLNLADLNTTMDSVGIIHEKRVAESLYGFLYSGNLYKGKELDTTSIANQNYTIDTDSLFNTLADRDKSSVVSAALEKARSVANEFNNEHIGSKNILEINRKQLAQLQVEWHMKFALSSACLIFFFIGAPLGAIIRKGGLGMPAVVSLALFIGYFILSSTGKKMAVQGSWDPVIAVWLPSLILLPLGGFLTYKSTTDSALFNAERYVEFFKKIFFIKNRKDSIDIDSLLQRKPSGEELSSETIINSLSSLNKRCKEILDEKFTPGKLSRKAYSVLLESESDWLKNLQENYEQQLVAILADLNNRGVGYRELLQNYPSLTYKKYSFTKRSSKIIGVLFYLFPLNLLVIAYLGLLRNQLKSKLEKVIEVNEQLKNYYHKNTEQ